MSRFFNIAKRGLGAAVLVGSLWIATPDQASADVFKLYAAPKIGAAFGNGNARRDFYEWAGGGAAGFDVGMKFLFVGVYAEYLRFFGGDATANLWSINLGGDTELKLTENWGIVLRLAGSWYFGSLEDNVVRNIDGVEWRSEYVDTNGIGFRGGVGPRYTFMKFFSVGITPQVGYHYFFAGAEGPVERRNTSSTGWDVQALAYFQAAFGL